MVWVVVRVTVMVTVGDFVDSALWTHSESLPLTDSGSASH